MIKCVWLMIWKQILYNLQSHQVVQTTIARNWAILNGFLQRNGQPLIQLKVSTGFFVIGVSHVPWYGNSSNVHIINPKTEHTEPWRFWYLFNGIHFCGLLYCVDRIVLNPKGIILHNMIHHFEKNGSNLDNFDWEKRSAQPFLDRSFYGPFFFEKVRLLSQKLQSQSPNNCSVYPTHCNAHVHKPWENQSITIEHSITKN